LIQGSVRRAQASGGAHREVQPGKLTLPEPDAVSLVISPAEGGMLQAATENPDKIIETDIPKRLDRLPWARFHTLVVVALGFTWILDGLEVTLAGSISGALKGPGGLGLDDAQIGDAASAYLAGAVLGALGFGYLADRLGRRKLFFITLGLYLAATAATALSFDAPSYMLFRFLTGAGIGGEYAAINSAIQEFIPARFRGRTDLGINGSYWFGAALGAAGTVGLLDPGFLPAWLGWRLAFGIGAVLGLGIIFLRRFVPETPRWLIIHGQVDAAEQVTTEIERQVERSAGRLPPLRGEKLRLRIRGPARLDEFAAALFRTYPTRAILGLCLMGAQAFLYNAIFFTYALVLGRFYGVPAGRMGLYLLPFALSNALGPILLGHLFDSLGRKAMISATYAVSGTLLALGGWLFAQGVLGAAGMTVAWTVVFFFASPAASSAYLTVSESFPLETRALAIAVFYALGTALGGIAGPFVFGRLIGTGDRGLVFDGYLVGAALMLAAAAVELAIGVKAEGRALEDIAKPLATLPE
jgi:MFS family permease